MATQHLLPHIKTVQREYRHVGMLSPQNGDSPLKRKVKLYKYMSLEALFKTLRNGLRFREPSQWPDKFEQRFYHANYSHLTTSEPMPMLLYACCMTSKKESEVAWKNYLDIDKGYLRCPYCVRITLKRVPFLKMLSQWAMKNSDYRVYEGAVEYHKRYTIESMHLPKMPGAISIHNAFFCKGNFELEDFLSLLLLKREAFDHEKEVRYFIVPPKCSKDKYFDLSINPNDWSNIIESITIVEPYNTNGISSSSFTHIEGKIRSEFPFLSNVPITSLNPYEDSVLKSGGPITILP